MSSETDAQDERQERIESYLKKTACILRAFNNEHVVKQVANLLNIGLGLVIVVVDQRRDGSGRDTLEYLKAYANDPRVKIEYIPANFGWSVALNWGIRSLKIQNQVYRLNNGGQDGRWWFVFNVSVEAKFLRRDVMAMLSCLDYDKSRGVIGTTWKGMKNGNQFELGWTYGRPRNTGSMWRIEVFNDIEFDPWCDHCLPITEGGVEKKLGGMEDFDAMIRAFIYKGWRSKMLKLNVHLVVGVAWNQAEKEKREQDATREILKRLRAQFEGDSSERSLIDHAIHVLDLNLE